VHAQHIGHPVAGDDKYGDREANKRLAEQAGLKRLFLHRAAMGFDLSGKPYTLNAPLADELSAVLDRCKGRRVFTRTGRWPWRRR
jgi:23S rRNA pseudouridine955/2504/2580 synthase